MSTKREVIAKLDTLFAPDIRIKLDDSNRITSAEALTTGGALFILRYPLLGTDYDTAMTASDGLCFEQIETRKNNEHSNYD